ncbi:MAG: sulfate adenylyltransferase [Thermoplasmata archaeon]|nr:sulfate adenylyltransferase [Thermoplasmata archaeon]
MIRPHGGRLIDRTASDREREALLGSADEMTSLDVHSGKASEIQNIATGVYSPLEGFFSGGDLESVLDRMRLEDDTPWTIPIVLDVPKSVKAGEDIVLRHDGKPMAVMNVEDVHTSDLGRYSRAVFGTDDPQHPGVAKVKEMTGRFAGGRITLLNEYDVPFPEFYLRPSETRVLFREKGWETVVAFQTRNPPHVGHEYVQKAALTFTDGLLINPVIGKKKSGDFQDGIILKTYQKLVEHYYPKDRVVLSTLLIDMWYGGPKEAILHAIMRKNLGCTHIIIGRDHAGVGKYYGPFDAHEIFKQFPDLEIEPFTFRSFAYCPRCGSPVNDKICPHDKDLINYSGTMVRALVNEGKLPSREMMRPEVAEVIAAEKDVFVE